MSTIKQHDCDLLSVTAQAFLVAETAFNNDPENEELGLASDEAFDAFQAAVGFEFYASPSDVAELVVDVMRQWT